MFLWLLLLSSAYGASVLDSLSGLIRDISEMHQGEPAETMFMYRKYDFIIIGAGSAGCVLSNRLTEEKSFKVLLLEAGGPELVFMDIPLIASVLQLTQANWDYRTEPQENGCVGMQDGRCAWPRGKVVGGSSVLNSMMYTRGNKKDYDAWADAGNTGWDYNTVLEYFKKLENMQIPRLQKDKMYHSTNGHMTIEEPGWRTPLSDAFLEAGVATGGELVDYNAESQIGYSVIQFTMNNGTRMSASKGYLHPIRKRKNFHILKFATVTKILIDPITKQAYGVEFKKGGIKYIVTAKREVILSAGAINSPQILMLSGIGPTEHLSEKNITTIVDLPVGYNLQDHWALGGLTFIINTTDSIRSERVLTPENFKEYFAHHTGPLTAPTGTEAIAFFDTTDPSNKNGHSDLELLFVGGSLVSSPLSKNTFAIGNEVYDTVYKPIKEKDTWMVFPMVLRPKSRGRVLLKDKDPHTKPLIYANYFTDVGHDEGIVLQGIRKTIQLSRTKPFQKYGSKLHDIPLPTCAHHKFDSDAYWICAMKSVTCTIYHHCCTNKMGPSSDPAAVVDPRLRVYGIKGLRVVDASVMPNIPSGHTNGPTLMIAERAADMIKEDWGIPV